MARGTVSEEEILLRKRARRRLVGAVALVILSAIVLPMVFDDRIPPVGNVEIQIQDEKTAPPFQAAVTPVSAAEAVSAPAPAAPPAQVSSPPPESHGFFLQLGVFSNDANAGELRQKLSGLGLHSLAEPVKGGGAVRILAGPFASREEADKAQRKVGRTGLLGVVESR